MKKLTRFITALVAVCALALCVALSACAKDGRQPTDGKIENGYTIVYAFTVDEEIMTVDDGSMYDYMNALKSRGELAFEGSDGQYGFFITSVLGVGSMQVSSTANSYSGWDWAVYTTVTTVDGVIYSDDKTTVEINGVTFYKSTNGVSLTPCITGESYALVYEFSQMSW